MDQITALANERTPGRDVTYSSGLFKYNRADMTFDQMNAMRKTEGDLFAVFRDEYGGVHIQYSRFEDFSSVALIHLLKVREEDRSKADQQTMRHLVGILMLSRIHGYHFEDFIQILDHTGKQVFDMKELCLWIAMNEQIFTSDVEYAIAADADDREAMEKSYDSTPAFVED